jgi:hypothetical protein
MKHIHATIIGWYIVVMSIFLFIDTRSSLVLVGTAPLLVHALFLLIAPQNKQFFWIMPLLFPTLFYISSLFVDYGTLDVASITFWQIVFIALLHAVLSTYQTQEQKELHHAKTHVKHLEEKISQAQQNAHYYEQQAQLTAQKVKELESITQSNVQTFFRGVEDKCKAMNFVIGRVFSDKKGGSATIRSHLQIPRDIYNEFSKLSITFEKKDEILSLLTSLYNKLLVLEMPMYDVPQLSSSHHQRVIEYLASNDTDPVQTYFDECKAITVKLIEYIQAVQATQHQ